MYRFHAPSLVKEVDILSMSRLPTISKAIEAKIEYKCFREN